MTTPAGLISVDAVTQVFPLDDGGRYVALHGINLDIAAGELGLDQVAFRRHNLLRRDEMPSPLPIVMPYGTGGETDSGDYHETFERCLQEIGWTQKVALAGRQVDGVFHGIAVGCYIEGGGSGPREHARMVFEGDGRVSVHVGSSAVGQGLETIFAQIAADALGLPMDRISGVFHGSSGIVKTTDLPSGAIAGSATCTRSR